MDWKPLNHPDQLDEITSLSQISPQYIFKHSTRCSVSTVAKNRLEKGVAEHAKIYYLDLLTYRSISNEISNRWNIIHQSPQLLKIVNGTCTYHASHLEINPEDIFN